MDRTGRFGLSGRMALSTGLFFRSYALSGDHRGDLF